MEIKSIIDKLSIEQKNAYNNSKFLKIFSDFLENYFSFIFFLLVLFIWQLLVFIDNPYSNELLEVFVAITLLQKVSNKFLKSNYIFIPIILIIFLIYFLKQYGQPYLQWLIILSTLIIMKYNMTTKKDKEMD